MAPPAVDAGAAVLVCGLGALGQACLRRLVAFNIPLRCLDLARPSWSDPELENRLSSQLILGDMRLPHVLRAAGVEHARAVLLLSSESTVNIEAALQVRVLNPQADIVVRSTSRQSSLGELLEDRLPGIAVVDPLLLCAGAIVSALRPETIPASFEADGHDLQICAASQPGMGLARPLQLAHPHQHPDLVVMPRSHPHHAEGRDDLGVHRWRRRTFLTALQRAARGLARLSRAQHLLCGSLLALALIGVGLFSGPGGWRQGVFVTLGLLKGEYVDPVNLLLSDGPGVAAASGWLIGGTLVYALVGTLLTSALAAVILERLLRDRLGASRPRLPRRSRRPILLVEGAGLAERVVQLLRRDGRPLVRVGPGASSSATELLVPDLTSALQLLGDRELRAVALLSSDLLANLQTALTLQQRWPQARIALLAHSFGAADELGGLLGGMAVVSAVDLVADAVVATAFGERIEAVLRLGGIHLLQVRFRISKGDTLCERNVARIQNGYNVTVITLYRPRQGSPTALPKLETVVSAGDQLVALATAESLRRIELGDATPPGSCVGLQVVQPLGPAGKFEVQRCLARWLGCSPGEVCDLLDGREHLTPAMDMDLCEPLCAQLRQLGVRCWVENAKRSNVDSRQSLPLE
jgi:Trk K+ transport system NAD-binding subunit